MLLSRNPVTYVASKPLDSCLRRNDDVCYAFSEKFYIYGTDILFRTVVCLRRYDEVIYATFMSRKT